MRFCQVNGTLDVQIALSSDRRRKTSTHSEDVKTDRSKPMQSNIFPFLTQHFGDAKCVTPALVVWLAKSWEIVSTRRWLMSIYVLFALSMCLRRLQEATSGSTHKVCPKSLESCRGGTRVGSTLWRQHRPAHKIQKPWRSPKNAVSGCAKRW